jgi:hypothetical protein
VTYSDAGMEGRAAPESLMLVSVRILELVAPTPVIAGGSPPSVTLYHGSTVNSAVSAAFRFVACPLMGSAGISPAQACSLATPEVTSATVVAKNGP